jgi:hypothetical protein
MVEEALEAKPAMRLRETTTSKWQQPLLALKAHAGHLRGTRRVEAISESVGMPELMR